MVRFTANIVKEVNGVVGTLTKILTDVLLFGFLKKNGDHLCRAFVQKLVPTFTKKMYF